MRKRSSIWLFVILIFIIPFSAFALFNWYEKKVSSLPILVSKEHTIQAFDLQNQEGEKYSLDDWEGKIVVAGFFFTHCPTICPKMTKHMQMVQKDISSDKEILLASFTVDPENDSPAQLKDYCNQRKIDNSNWVFVTGDKKEIYKLARNSFKIVATDGDGGPTDFIHSEKLVLLDKQKRIRGYYDGTSDAATEQLITDIKKLKHEN